MQGAASVFISYSRTDRAFVSVAMQLLRAGGASVFFDVTSIEFGEKWEDQLGRAIEKCERVLVFWSTAAAASAWVQMEWRSALARGKRIVPLQLDGAKLPDELARYQGIVGLFEVLRDAMAESVKAAERASRECDPFAAAEAAFRQADDMRSSGTAKRFTDLVFSE